MDCNFYEFGGDMDVIVDTSALDLYVFVFHLFHTYLSLVFD
jgi:hypothetical protein